MVNAIGTLLMGVCRINKWSPPLLAAAFATTNALHAEATAAPVGSWEATTDGGIVEVVRNGIPVGSANTELSFFLDTRNGEVRICTRNHYDHCATIPAQSPGADVVGRYRIIYSRYSGYPNPNKTNARFVFIDTTMPLASWVCIARRYDQGTGSVQNSGCYKDGP